MSSYSTGDYSRNLCIVLGTTLGILALAILAAAVHVYLKDHPRRQRARGGTIWRRPATPVDDAEIESWRRPTGQFIRDEKGFRVQMLSQLSQQRTLAMTEPTRPDRVRIPTKMNGPPWAPWAEPDPEYGYFGDRTTTRHDDANRASSRYSQQSQYSNPSRFSHMSRASQPPELSRGSSDPRLSTIYSSDSGRYSPHFAPETTSPRGLIIRTPSPISPTDDHSHTRSEASEFDFGFAREYNLDELEESPKSVSTANSSRHLGSHHMSDRY